MWTREMAASGLDATRPETEYPWQMSLTPEQLRESVSELASRPRHDKVSYRVTELLTHQLEISAGEIDFEHPIKEVQGRTDALLGRTIFEFKSDLRRERRDAEDQLTRYLGQRERETQARYVGIATDGALFLAYELRDGALIQLSVHAVQPGDPQALVLWLDTAIARHDGLEPDPETVRKELGKESLTYAVARGRLLSMWQEVRGTSEAQVKRHLWEDLLEIVYGARVESDELFLQHTFLTIVAKTMAVRVLGMTVPAAADLLSGTPFEQATVEGAVESDFFDWVLLANDGPDFVSRVAIQAARFRLENVQTDVLKELYESLVDLEQRKLLGEYYTPDWLADMVCERAIERPLEQRVLDPACGSGTFLFHSIRRFLQAADAAGMENQDALTHCISHVFGMDVHPVAVLIARVTYLLALGEDRLRNRPPLSIPVYLGDSLQWNTHGILFAREVQIGAPGERVLHYPSSVAASPRDFDAIVQAMDDFAAEDSEDSAFAEWLGRHVEIDEADRDTLLKTYGALRNLHQEGSDHIWRYVTTPGIDGPWEGSTAARMHRRADALIGHCSPFGPRVNASRLVRRLRAPVPVGTERQRSVALTSTRNQRP